MSNEVLFLLFALLLISINLVAFRLGKVYMFVLITVYSLLMNIFVTKQFTLFGLDVTGGNALYGAIFLLTDIFSEHYSKRDAFKSILIGFMTVLVFVVSTQFLIAFTPNGFDFAHESIATLFSVTPRILVGSLIAYAVAQSLDVFLYDWIKKLTKGKYLFLRNNVSTFISQFVDSIIFTAVGLTTFASIGLEGIIPSEIFWEVALATYVIKLIVAVIDTPFIYLSYLIKPKNK